MVTPSTAESMTLKELEQEVIENPDDASLKKRLGWAYYHAGEAFEAKETLEAVRSRVPNDVEVLYALGVVLKKIGENDEAREFFQKIIQLSEGKDVGARPSMLRHLAKNQIVIMDRS